MSVPYGARRHEPVRCFDLAPPGRLMDAPVCRYKRIKIPSCCFLCNSEGFMYCRVRSVIADCIRIYVFANNGKAVQHRTLKH